MTCDESLYRQYLNGDDEGLNALMKKYGDPLTLYIDGYLHDVHEAEELMLDVFAYLFMKKPRIRDGGFKAYLYKAARHLWTECRVYAAVHGADAGGGHICSAGTDRRMGRVRRDAAAGGRGRLCAGGRCLLCSSGGHHRAVLPAQEKRKSEKRQGR